MNIIEATREAMRRGVGITNASMRKRGFYVLPTNTDECYLIVPKGWKIGHGVPAPRWNPRAEDILTEDWEVALNATDAA